MSDFTNFAHDELKNRLWKEQLEPATKPINFLSETWINLKLRSVISYKRQLIIMVTRDWF